MSDPKQISRPRLYVIRHGETAWSLTGQHTGLTDIPLTIYGEEEARELKPRLEHIDFAHVFTSPEQRALKTCELAGLSGSAETEPDLAEWDYGDYEGRRTVDIHQERPGWELFRDGAPNGESPEQITRRADRLIARLRLLSGNIALFTHGHFSRVLAMRWIDLPIVDGRNFALDTASISILGYDPGHTDTPVIQMWNFASH